MFGFYLDWKNGSQIFRDISLPMFFFEEGQSVCSDFTIPENASDSHPGRRISKRPTGQCKI
jgi:hypothetical protein